jgi:hypothetical protein
MVADPNYFTIDLYRAIGFAPTETQLQIERPIADPLTGTGSTSVRTRQDRPDVLICR